MRMLSSMNLYPFVTAYGRRRNNAIALHPLILWQHRGMKRSAASKNAALLYEFECISGDQMSCQSRNSVTRVIALLLSIWQKAVSDFSFKWKAASALVAREKEVAFNL